MFESDVNTLSSYEGASLSCQADRTLTRYLPVTEPMLQSISSDTTTNLLNSVYISTFLSKILEMSKKLSLMILV